jgi:hypothetical protein
MFQQHHARCAGVRQVRWFACRHRCQRSAAQLSTAHSTRHSHGFKTPTDPNPLYKRPTRCVGERQGAASIYQCWGENTGRTGGAGPTHALHGPHQQPSFQDTCGTSADQHAAPAVRDDSKAVPLHYSVISSDFTCDMCLGLMCTPDCSCASVMSAPTSTTATTLPSIRVREPNSPSLTSQTVEVLHHG